VVAGRYRLDEVVGSGGMGTVWRALDQELGTVVALKQARRDDVDTAAGQQALRRLRREARIAAGLDHPHVVAVLDVVGDGAEWWLVMEYVPSRSLAEILQAQGCLEPPPVARLGAQLADALAAVHAKGVLHRDVKPGNVLVAADGTAKLADFGISRTVHGDETLTHTGLVPGTPGFLAPEVADGLDPEAASDVFSLGATLFAAVEGTPPVGEAANPLVAVRRAAAGEIMPPRRAGPLTPVLKALLRIHPTDRPDAAGAARMLRDVADGRVPVVPAGSRRRAHRGMAVLAAAVAAALLIAVGLLVSRTGGSTPAATPVPAVGDPHTADPCALTDPAALARFGETRRDTDYGNFNRCDVIVEADGVPGVDVEVALKDAEDAPSVAAVDIEQVGQLRILPELAEDDTCSRYVLLPDSYLVSITAKQPDDSAVDLCAITEVATGSAVTVLRRGEIPRRPAPFDAESLARVDACALLADDALAAVPGLDTAEVDPGFAGWGCRWRSSTDPISVRLRFDRDQPLTPDDGRPTQIDGRYAVVEPEGDGDETCLVQVVHRPYADTDANPAVELMLVVVSGPAPPEQLCAPATDLAEAAAARLPP